MAQKQEIIDFGGVEDSATLIKKENEELRNYLQNIENHITSLEGSWESDSAAAIRTKIRGMKPKFEQYYKVVDNYVKLLHNAVADYRATERTNKSNADQFN